MQIDLVVRCSAVVCTTHIDASALHPNPALSGQGVGGAMAGHTQHDSRQPRCSGSTPQKRRAYGI